MLTPVITIARKLGSQNLMDRVRQVTKLAAYVGIPADNASRQDVLLTMAGKAKGKRKKAYLQHAAANDVNNAELLFIHTKGSPINKIPARPVIEPAVQASGNKESITRQITASVKASLAGDKDEAGKRMVAASLAGQNAARKFFTDPRNGWEPNTPGTIKRKGSDRPLIDTGNMRNSIVGVVRSDE